MVRDLDTHPPERLYLPGPAGRLHATLERPRAAPRAGVLHLHPHPLHGGSRQNNVVRYGALGSLAAHCTALRIDFRGVGRSDGSYDEGTGEVDDAAAALEWLGGQFPGVPLFVWGFSFGSRVGLDLALRADAGHGTDAAAAGTAAASEASAAAAETVGAAEPAGYLGVAWPTNFYAWPETTPWPRRSAFLAGSDDEFVNLEAMQRARDEGAALQIVAGATHFFHHRLDAVRDWTRATLESWL